MDFATLTANIKANVKDFNTKMKGLNKTVKNMSNEAQRDFRKVFADMGGEINDKINEPLNKTKMQFKDVSRIVQGIVISKVFYESLNAIRNATSAVWDFTQELEYAQVSYANLFGDAALAEEFINVLQDFAATTPFTFKDSEKAARRLLAYGIEYKNVMYMMKGVLSASVMSGDEYAMERVSRALGQIYTKGRLMTQEMTQLSEAGVAAYDILQEKLGLTREQLQNLGKEAIPANIAINALVEGMVERYGAVADASSLTIKGLISNIKDNFTMMASGLTTTITDRIRVMLKDLAEIAMELRNIQATQGAGGVFERIIPKEMHSTLRYFIADIMMLYRTFKLLGAEIGKITMQLGRNFIIIFNSIAPLVNAVVNVFAHLIQIINSNEVAFRALTAVITLLITRMAVIRVAAVLVKTFGMLRIAVAALLGPIAKLINLIKVLTLALLRKGIPTMLAIARTAGIARFSILALVAAFAALLLFSDKARERVGKLFKSFNDLGGVKADEVLLPDSKDRANDLSKFNNALETTAEDMENLKKQTEKTNKSLLSFDEVFRLNDLDADAGLTDIEELLNIPKMEGLEAIIPEMPDLSGYGKDFAENLWDILKDEIERVGIGAGIGALIGGILGKSLAGAKIGGAAGALIAFFWDDIIAELGLTDTQGKASLISGGILMAFGKALPIIAKKLPNIFTKGLPKLLTKGAGGPIGLVAGIISSLLTSALINELAKKFGKTEEDLEKAGIGQMWGSGIGTVLGAVIGTIIAPGVGTAIGALIGGIAGDLIGGLSGLFSEDIAAGFSKLGQWFKDLGSKIGTWYEETKPKVVNWFSETGNKISTWYTETKTKVHDWFENALIAVIDWYNGTVDKVVDWFANGLKNTITFFTEGHKLIPQWCEEAKEAIKTWYTETSEKISTWVDTTNSRFNYWLEHVDEYFLTWCTNTKNNIATWYTETKTKIINWATETDIKIRTWTTETGAKINTWATETKTKITTWADETKLKISTWATETKSKIISWADETKQKFITWITDTKAKISGFFDSLPGIVTEKLNTFKTNAINGLNNIYTAFKNFIDDLHENVFSDLFGWIDDGAAKVKDFLKIDYKKSGNTNKSGLSGHATGGIFNKEHIARFAEGNKAEAVIPLQNASAMQPFVDAVSNGIVQGLAPVFANMGGAGTQQLQPLYVGTLVADERGLRELNRRMEVIQMQERNRRGV